MLWSAGLEAPRHVWVHGWLLAAGGERMSKSRGNFLDPNDFVAAFGQDGARYVVLREVPFDRDAEVSWDSFVRRYNADLANDFGNLLNRTVSMTNRYLDGERPAPRAGGRLAPGARAGPTRSSRYRAALEGCRLHEALAELWEFVGGANKVVDAEQPWAPGQGREGRRRGGRSAPARRPRRPAGGVPADRPGRGAVPARRPRRGSSPSSGSRVRLRSGRQRRTGRSSTSSPGARTRPTAGRVDRAGAALPAARDRSRHDRRARDARGASRRLPLPRQRRSLHRRRRGGRRGGPSGGRGADPRPGLERRRPANAPSTSSSGSPGWMPPSASIPHDAAKVDDAGWARIVALGGSTGGAGHRRDRARLRPGLQPDPGPADQPAPQPRPRRRHRPAGDPALPLGRWRSRRPGRPARRAPGDGTGLSRAHRALVLRSARLRPRDARPRGRV